MEHKPMESVPQDVWRLIAKRLSQKDRSSARTASRFFFNKMTPSGIAIVASVGKFAPLLQVEIIVCC